MLVNIAPLTNDGFIRIYRNDGNGVFVGQDILGSLTIEHGEAQWGDYDADGNMDILVAGNLKEINGTYTHMALRIYRNNGTGYDSLTVIPCLPCEGWFDLTAATWADYENDGDIDILLAGTYNSGSQIEGRVKVYLNNNGAFADSGNVLPAPRASGDRGGTFSWFDLDGLVEAQMHVYRNDAPGQNDAPSTPSGLNAVIHADSTVLLSWIASTDDHTPSVALTYDLELYRDNVPVTLPNRLPQPGSVSAVTQWQLAGLQNGHYRWTIRAVDAAYIGSPVAVGEFTIGPVSADEPGDDLPRSFALEQNYPNPFNPKTSVRFQVPSLTLVTLKVYDLLGREVATLVNDEKAPGTYIVTWDATNFASGIYYYRMTAGSFSDVKKLVFLK